MIKNLNKRRLWISIFALVVYFSVPLYNNISNTYLNNSLKDSMITYASLRGINGAVSMIQHSSVGMSLVVKTRIAAGELLDPIQNAIERVSDLMTISIWSLGSEKIFYEVSKTSLMVWILIILSLISLFDTSEITQKILIILIVLRLFVPFSALFANYLNHEMFQPKIKKELVILNYKPTNLKKQSVVPKTHNTSFWDRTVNHIHKTIHSVSKIEQSTSYYVKNSEKIISALLNIAILYLGRLIINIILLPLLLFYILQQLNSSKSLYDKSRNNNL